MKNLIFVLCFLSFFPKAQNIYTYAGTGSSVSSGDGGSALSAGIDRPSAVYMDTGGNLFIATVYQPIRKVDASGIITTTVTGGYSYPYGITFDPLDNMYIAYVGTINSNNYIRKLNTSNIMSTFVGTGSCSIGGDGGPATSANICSPDDVSFDSAGNMYIADSGNNRIRKVSPSGTITTIAGTGGISYTGDGGPATAAELDNPSAVKADAAGNIYIADRGHNCIRKIDLLGIITTIAGTGVAGYTGDGGPATAAQLNGPQDLVLDGVGNIFIAERYCVRKINSTGIITTVAGTGVAGYSGDGGPAILAKFDFLAGLCLDASGNIYVSDFNNNRVRVICMSSCAMGIDENRVSNEINIYPNPASDKLFLQNIEDVDIKKSILVSTDGKEIALKGTNKQEFDVSTLPEGLYFLQLQTDEGVLTRKIIIQR